jgi:hypothetical protein
VTRHPEIFAALAAPFAPEEVKTLPKGKGMKYITARTAMNRLDNVLGPEAWWDDYFPGENSVICRLTIVLPDGQQLTKVDAGGYAGMADGGDDDKSGFSDAFKRTAVKFGVGRYLYKDGVPDFAMSDRSGYVHREPRRETAGTNGNGAPSRGDVNQAFKPRETRRVHEAAEDDGPTPKPQPTTWAAYVRDRVDRAKKAWATEMVVAGIAPDVRAHPDFAMPNEHEVTNHFVSHAVKSGAIAAEAIAKDDKPGIRDPAKAKAAMAELFAKAPKKIRAAVDAYFAEKERALRVKMGMDDADDGAEPAAVGGREAGSDDE